MLLSDPLPHPCLDPRQQLVSLFQEVLACQPSTARERARVKALNRAARDTRAKTLTQSPPEVVQGQTLRIRGALQECAALQSSVDNYSACLGALPGAGGDWVAQRRAVAAHVARALAAARVYLNAQLRVATAAGCAALRAPAWEREVKARPGHRLLTPQELRQEVQRDPHNLVYACNL